MSRQDRIEDDMREALALRGLTLAAILDMSPVDLHAELAQAALEGSQAAKNIVNSTGFDEELRAWQAGQGQEELLDRVLPDAVQDPFRDAFAAVEELSEPSIYEHPTGLPDLVVQASMGL